MLLSLLASACASGGHSGSASSLKRIEVVRYVDPLRPVLSDPPIALRSARNQTVHFAIQITAPVNYAAKKPPTLNFRPLQIGKAGAAIPPESITAYQVLSMPVDANRAGYVRHTGVGASAPRLPRALLPLAITKGVISLGALRNPDSPTDLHSHPSSAAHSPVVIWFDIQVPPTVAAGDYQSSCELVDDGDKLAVVPVHLAVDDFVLPDDRHLLMAGALDWSGLERLYPDQFRGIVPELLTRREPKYAAAIRTFDQMVQLAHAHRVQLVIPRIQPLVKWPSGRPPQIDWTDFDAVVSPWLKGTAFPDSLPMSYWPLPAIDHMDELDLNSRLEYWRAAAAHFDQLDWLTRSGVTIARQGGGRVQLAESVRISELAARILSVHPRLRVTVPLEEEQVQLASERNPFWLRPDDLPRLRYAAAGLVSAPPLQRLPEVADLRWLRTDQPGAAPYLGAGADAREVRLWAWLAWVRNASLIHWSSVLPAQDSPGAIAAIDDLTWFYPGSWFGLDQPIPTIQLKWLRDAEQDYEYLWLARQRGQQDRLNTLTRLLVKPVELQPDQSSDQTYALLSGTSDLKAWDDCLSLLSRIVRLAPPGQLVDAQAERQLSYDLSIWSQLQERPTLMARSADWSMGLRDSEGQWLDLRLGVDIYNAAYRQPESSTLKWGAVPDAWRTRGEATAVPKMGTFTVNHFPLKARVNLDKLSSASRNPLRLAFSDGYTNKTTTLDVSVPAAICERRTGAPPQCDGSLGDWSVADALHEGKLIQMLSRPAVQSQQLQLAPTNSAVYSTWTPSHLYLGFKVEGADGPVSNAQTSFVRYDFRRAWGEDICQVIMQPIYADGSVGPLLQVACKPYGQLEVSRRLDPRLNANPWMGFTGADIRYAANMDGPTWRGELAIPWDAINPPGAFNKRPVLLRFNFIQHRASTGQSSTWAGPIDYDRDESLLGILYLR